MSCNRCGQPAQGRLCSICEGADRMDDMAENLTEKYDEEGDGDD